MMTDKLNTFAGTPAAAGSNAGWTGTTIPTAIGTAVVGDVIDLFQGNAAKPNVAGPVGPNGEIGGPLNLIPDAGGPGSGAEVQVYAQINAAVTSGGTAVVGFELRAADSADLVTTNPIVLRKTATATGATPFAAGTLLRELMGPIPPAFANRRYLGIVAVTATAVLTGGTLSAFLSRDMQQAAI
jgi:hypothetical protein